MYQLKIIEKNLNSLYRLKPPAQPHKDIAEVQEGPQAKRGDASVSAKASAKMSIQKQHGASTINLTKNIDKTPKDLSTNLPKGVVEPEIFKQSRFICEKYSMARIDFHFDAGNSDKCPQLED